MPDRQTVLDIIRKVITENGGNRPKKEKLLEKIPAKVLSHYFPKDTMTTACSAAGFSFDRYHAKIDLQDWLADWGSVVRNKGVPTRMEYKSKKYGNKYSPGVFENDPAGGRWSSVPSKFREFAENKAEWADVLPKLPLTTSESKKVTNEHSKTVKATSCSQPSYSKLDGRPTYGNPIDFRGLRHEPVNEQGVVFLFGMVARELGYMVEGVQTGYPDCEAKRQVEGGRWQSVRIEFEFESRNFNHPPDGCDVIVCWRHNWPQCPEHIEVVELSSVIKTLAKSDD
jgi:hypothetical protein